MSSLSTEIAPATNTLEFWKDIPGYEGYYQVSDHGRVRSLDRIVTRKTRLGEDSLFPLKGKIKIPSVMHSGHLMVWLARDGVRARILVHRLVLFAFVGPCPEGMECCHNDGNPANNVPSNLRWGTRSDNMKDKVRHGRMSKTNIPIRGSKHWNSKLTADNVRAIRRFHASGEYDAEQLAVMYNVCSPHIREIVRRVCWGHLPD